MMVTFKIGDDVAAELDMGTPTLPDIGEELHLGGKVYVVKDRVWNVDKGYYPEAGDGARLASVEMTVYLVEVRECACPQPAYVSGSACGRCNRSLRGRGVQNARAWFTRAQ